ncbi:MAG: LptF/LptG family permease [Myxococcaceae bacterium]|nr:LptF/LptG family permease [Myxococcaceae bacterium]
MTRIDRAAVQEVLQAFGAWLGLLMVMLVALAFLRGADVLLGTGVGLGDLGRFFVLVAPQFLVQAGPVAFLLAVLLAFGRWSDDGEWAALAALGVRRSRLLRGPVLVAVALSGALALVALEWQPWGLRQVSAMVAELVQRNVTGDVRPGEFHEEVLGFTLYTAARDPDGTWHDVLLADERNPTAPLLVLAERGVVHTGVEREAASLELSSGEVHRAEKAGDRTAAMDFQRADFRLDLSEAVFQRSRQRSVRDELTWGELVEAETAAAAAGEPWRPFAVARWWRLGQVLSPVPFAVVAVPLALGRRRGGRSRGVVLSLATYVVFYLLARAFVSLGERAGLWPPVAGLAPDLAVLLLGGLLLLRERPR